MAQHFARDRRDAEIDGPERESEQRRHDHEDAGRRGPRDRDAPQRPLRPGEETSSEPAGVRH
jgi:hypothetical protein